MLGLALAGHSSTTRRMNFNCSGIFIFLYLMIAFFLMFTILWNTTFFHSCTYINGQLV